MNITILDRLFIEYYKFLQQANLSLYTSPDDKINQFLAANMSFDEFFNQYILTQLPSPVDQIRKETIKELFDRSGISFEEFNKPFNFNV